MRSVALALLLSGLCAASALAGGLVRGEGRAPIAGDARAARDAALADALYDAAGRAGTKVRGVSQLSNGVLQEESTAFVDGRLHDWRIAYEGREGGFYVVTVEGHGERAGEGCSAGRADLDLRAIQLRLAPNISGRIERSLREQLARSVALLGEGEHFRVADQRHLPEIRGAERAHASQYDYMAQLTDSRPSVAGYSIAGEIVVERSRRDNFIAEMSDIVATAVLKLRDNYSGAQIGAIRRSVSFPGRRAIFGLDEAFALPEQVDLAAFFAAVRADIEARLACRPLRAHVVQSQGRELLLSVGLEHGIREGDYFLLAPAGGKRQVVRIAGATPTQSVARALKPGVAVPVDALATLIR